MPVSILHGVGPLAEEEADLPIRTADSLQSRGNIRYDVVLTNPPFGRKSSVLMVNEEGEQSREALTIYRDDFITTTSNKQLNCVKHVQSILKVNGRAAVVVPDNVLFEGGADIIEDLQAALDDFALIYADLAPAE